MWSHRIRRIWRNWLRDEILKATTDAGSTSDASDLIDFYQCWCQTQYMRNLQQRSERSKRILESRGTTTGRPRRNGVSQVREFVQNSNDVTVVVCTFDYWFCVCAAQPTTGTTSREGVREGLGPDADARSKRRDHAEASQKVLCRLQ